MTYFVGVSIATATMHSAFLMEGYDSTWDARRVIDVLILGIWSFLMWTCVNYSYPAVYFASPFLPGNVLALLFCLWFQERLYVVLIVCVYNAH